MKGLSMLPVEFQKNIRKYKRWQDSHASLYGKLLLKQGLIKMGFDCQLNEMKLKEYGKPYFENSPFDFNISHSHNYILCVISGEEKNNLGVDIEKIKPIDFGDFQNIWALNEEKNIVSPETFYDYWTRKEAIVKAVGMGMYYPLNKIDVSEPEVHCKGDVLHLRKISLDPDYVVHLASSKKINDVKLEYFSFLHDYQLQ